MTPADMKQFLMGRAIHAGAPGINNQFGSGLLDLGGLTSTPSGTTPLGALDSLTAFQGGVAGSGYAFDQDSPVPIRVDVTVDGRPTASAVAGIGRSDVPSPPGGAHGFATTVQVPPGPHTLCFTAVNSPGTLAGPDTSLGCRSAVAIARARRRPERRISTATAEPTSPSCVLVARRRSGGSPACPTRRSCSATPARATPTYRGRRLPRDRPRGSAVFRQTSPAQWWIAGRASPVTFGEPGDIPVPGDYNGDGITDVAVWRPGTPGRLFINGVGGSTPSATCASATSLCQPITTATAAPTSPCTDRVHRDSGS